MKAKDLDLALLTTTEDPGAILWEIFLEVSVLIPRLSYLYIHVSSRLREFSAQTSVKLPFPKLGYLLLSICSINRKSSG